MELTPKQKQEVVEAMKEHLLECPICCSRIVQEYISSACKGEVIKEKTRENKDEKE